MNITKKILIMVYSVALAAFFGFSGGKTRSIIDDHDIPSIENYEHIQPKLGEIEYISKYVYFSEVWQGRELIDDKHIYVIENADDLHYFSMLSSGPNRKEYLDKHYVLGNHIDFAEATVSPAHFRPIGFLPPEPGETDFDNSNAFSGIFDGQGFTIKFLIFEQITSTLYENPNVYDQRIKYISMFSRISSLGLVQNFGLINPILTQTRNFGEKDIYGASYVAGLNQGQISRVYVQDLRDPFGNNTGIVAMGGYHISTHTLFNRNELSNSYVATPRIANKNIHDNLSLSVMIHDASMYSAFNLFYDTDILLDTASDQTRITGRTTAQFSSSTTLSLQSTPTGLKQGIWTFKTTYFQYFGFNLETTYPFLDGTGNGTTYLYTAQIRYPSQFAWFINSISDYSNDFHKITTSLEADVDMAALSRNILKPTTRDFQGSFSGVAVTDVTKLYERSTDPRKAGLTYTSIIGLTIDQGIFDGESLNFGLFSTVGSATGGGLTGLINNLIFPRLTLNVTDDGSISGVKEINAGSIIGKSGNALQFAVRNIYIDAKISVGEIKSKINLGGIIGKHGYGDFSNTSISGNMNIAAQNFDYQLNDSSIGGIIGRQIIRKTTSTHINMYSAVNYMSITGLGFKTPPTIDVDTYLGGGVGSIDDQFTKSSDKTGTSYIYLQQFESAGQINPRPENTFNGNLYVGGILGAFDTKILRDLAVEMGTVLSINNSYNFSNISIPIYSSKYQIRLAGIANISGNGNTSTSAYSYINNFGKLGLPLASGVSFSNQELEELDVQVAGLIITHGRKVSIGSTTNATGAADFTKYSANYADFEIDLSITNIFSAGVINNFAFDLDKIGKNGFKTFNFSKGQLSSVKYLIKENYSTGLFNSNYGNITATTSHTLVNDNVVVTGCVASVNNVGSANATNYGKIDVNLTTDGIFSQPFTTDLDGFTSRSINIHGVANRGGYNDQHRYNLGDIKVRSTQDIKLEYDLFVSGVSGHSMSSSYSLNHGEIDVDTVVTGDSIVSGITTVIDIPNAFVLANLTQSYITKNAHNYGSIYNKRQKSIVSLDADYLRSQQITAGVIGASTRYCYLYGTTNSSTNISINNSISYGEISSESTIVGTGVIAGGIVGTGIYNTLTKAMMPDDKYNAVVVKVSINHSNITVKSVTTNNSLESNNYDLSQMTIAGGIIGIGTGNMTNVVNFGNISGTTIAGGIIGYVPLKKYGISGNDANYYATDAYRNLKANNLLNYGAISLQNIGVSSVNYGMGAFYGVLLFGSTLPAETNKHIYTANYFGYGFNFNKTNDLYGFILYEGPPTGVLIDKYQGYVTERQGTLKLNDQSNFPFNKVRSYTKNNDAPTGMTGLNGTTYSGIYQDGFYYMKNKNSGSYDNMITFLAYDDANTNLLDRIGYNESGLPGYFIMGGVTVAGENYFPYSDKMLDEISKRTIITVYNLKKNISSGEQLGRKIEIGVRYDRKKSNSFFTHLELMSASAYRQSLRNSYYLDEYTRTITYFVSDSYTDISPRITYTMVDTYIKADNRFTDYGAIETSPGVYKGEYRWNGSKFVKSNETDAIYVKISVRLYEKNAQLELGFLVSTGTLIDRYASFDYTDIDGQLKKKNKRALINRSQGPYNENDQLIDVNGKVLDDISDNYGMIRVFSESYEHDEDEGLLDPNTFTDYKILIKRINDVKLTENLIGATNSPTLGAHDINTYLTYSVNEYLSLEYTFENFIGNAYLSSTTNKLSIGTNLYNYQVNGYFTNQMGQGYTASWTTYFNVTISPNIQSIDIDDFGNIKYKNTYDSSGNERKDYFVALSFSLSETRSMRGGEFTLDWSFYGSYLNNQTFRVRFSREKNDTVSVSYYLAQVSNLYYIDEYTSGSNYDFSGKTNILYGTYYDSLDDYARINGKVVNFENVTNVTNLVTQNGTFYSPISCLDNIQVREGGTTISKFTFDREITSEGLNIFYIYITLHSEDGSKTYTMRLKIIEQAPPVTPVPSNPSKDGVAIDLSNYYFQKFYRNENPYFIYTYPQMAQLFYAQNSKGPLTLGFQYFGTGGTPVNNTEYTLNQGEQNFSLRFNKNSFIGAYELQYTYENVWTITGQPNNPLNGQTIVRNYNFEKIEFFKEGNRERLLEYIEFITEDFLTGLDTIIHPTKMNEQKYKDLLVGGREIILVTGDAIRYGTHTNKHEFHIIGQVSRTNLVGYQPAFRIPAGAKIYRVEGGVETTNLAADYTPISGTSEGEGEYIFNYIHYRIYAESYVPGHAEYGNLYTDYHIAVIDMTNTVTLNLTVIYGGADANPFDEMFINMRISDSGLDKNNSNTSFFTYFDLDAFGDRKKIGEQRSLPTLQSGDYNVEMNLPSGYTIEVKIDGNVRGSNGKFIIDFYILPRQYNVEFIIKPIGGITPPWGQTK